MKELSRKTLEKIAEAVCGRPGDSDVEWAPGPYRSLPQIEQFLQDCGATYTGVGSSRKSRALDALNRLAHGEDGDPFGDDPRPDIVEQVLLRLVDFGEFGENPQQAHRMAAHLNALLLPERVQLEFDQAGLEYRAVELTPGEYAARMQAKLEPPAQVLAEPAGVAAMAPPAEDVNTKVFIVHGHDEFAKSQAEALLHRLGLEPIVLHRQTNQGRTLIEKFEACSDVAYAIILLTPDDVGAPKENPEQLHPRARQNVVFEMGYFFAQLKRKNVMCLYKEGVELPSNASGIVYIPFSASIDEVETKVYRELRDAGLPVEL